MQSGKFIDCFKVCKCGMLCVNFYAVAVCNSADMGFWRGLGEGGQLPVKAKYTCASPFIGRIANF